MPLNFNKHYTVEEARQLLPEIRQWLEKLQSLRLLLQEDQKTVAEILPEGDAGGFAVNRSVRTLAAVRDVLRRFQSREIQIKDIERGLVDFPAFIGGREVFLCWEQDEEDIEFWHDLDSGYSSREKLGPGE